MNIQLLIIDPQNDFCDPAGALYVPGAERDMQRLAWLVRQLGAALTGVQVTLDTHARWDIAHPMWWKDAQGRPPAPFTQLRAADVEQGRWTPVRDEDREQSLRYLRELELSGRFAHTIWPEHCLAGDWGHNVYPELARALHGWEGPARQVGFVRKGENPWTEHFSAVRAEVPDCWDPATQPNDAFVHGLEQADLVLVAGQAATHCVLHTVVDLTHAFTCPDAVRKLVWLTDATSPVPDPEGTELFSRPLTSALRSLTEAGMRELTTTEVARRLARAAA